MEDNGFRRVPVRGRIGKKDGCSTLNVKDVTESLRKQVELCGKDGITFRPSCKTAL